MKNLFETLELLSDNQFHSGKAIGEKLGISRAAIWKIIESIRQKGIDVESVSGKGYKLETDIELLSTKKIRAALSKEHLEKIDQIEILKKIDSTNNYLMSSKVGPSKNLVCLAEEQVSGKGRNRRYWVSSFARNIALSIRWNYDSLPYGISGLSLAIGIAISRTCKSLGLNDVKLKWPNDVYINEKKLAGILIEIQGEPRGPCGVVVGIGLNISLNEKEREEIDQACTDILSELSDERTESLSRNGVVSLMISDLIDVLQQFEAEGFTPFVSEWNDVDLLAGHKITLKISEAKTIKGMCEGINKDGALMVDVGVDGGADGGSEVKPFYSGDASIARIAR